LWLRNLPSVGKINARFIRALDSFKEVDGTAGRLLDGIKKVNESLVFLDQFSDASPLHGKAKLRIGA
jgi:hypothetical protein